ncbi:CDP-diacylglycerol synthase [Trachipleistophora hominis]|uniref:Phosphatidate cytidylyltransferase n=1 Tax=Trachipleistophora hominis TaxID=72359 RepID=L7JT82_TRAHO|nr:CDP-diacylglycerol synthase [Trachipleistophora hominis]
MNFLANIAVSETVLKRTYAGAIMFAVLHIVLKDNVAVYLFVFVLKTFALNEVIGIKEENLRKKYRFKYLLWYFVTVSDLFFSKSIARPFYIFLLSLDFPVTHAFLCFSLYILGIVYFIVNLRRGVLRKQFLQFSITHFAIMMINFPVHCVFRNIRVGKFWFVYPILLVAANDIFAYVTGKLIGRTQLTKLSPKKTREGLIGGFIFTVIVGFFCIYLKCQFNIYEGVYDKAILAKTVTRYKIPAIYLHAIVLILFASFVAPFGGLLASAFKRLFKMKDFATYLPGHGGITDRIDCQILMGIFTRYYLSAFVLKRTTTVDKLTDMIIYNYSANEMKKLVLNIVKHLVEQ